MLIIHKPSGGWRLETLGWRLETLGCRLEAVAWRTRTVSYLLPPVHLFTCSPVHLFFYLLPSVF